MPPAVKSQKNVDIVRGLLTEWEHGSFPASALDPEVRIKWLAPIADRGETVGLEQAAAFLREWLTSFQHGRLIPERIIDANDKVVVIGLWRGRGKASGALAEWRHGQVWEIRNGKVMSIISDTHPSAALEAAGLSD
jgi:ketosteroid isomerase-like protein